MSNENRDPTPLSPREQEVARRVAEGATNQEIARALGLSFNTVKCHVARLMRKLGVHRRGAVAAAWEARASWARQLNQLALEGYSFRLEYDAGQGEPHRVGWGLTVDGRALSQFCANPAHAVAVALTGEWHG